MPATEAIASQWLERIARTYPAGAAGFIEREQDPFRNPVGHAFHEAAGILVGELLGGMDAERIAAALGSIVRIRAVQDFSPGQALAFIFELREVLRGEPALPDEVLCARLDRMALAAFDLYVRCREQTFEVRMNEARRRVGALERAMARSGERASPPEGKS